MSNIYETENKIIVFVNRLSDYFFVLSRYMLMEDQMQEILWKQPN